jgi:hypothetical protein
MNPYSKGKGVVVIGCAEGKGTNQVGGTES